VPKKLLQAVLVASLTILPAVADQPQRPSHPHAQAQPRLEQAAMMTLEKGFDAKLPPHISTLLKISNEQECSVKQSVTRNGSVVQGLDVSVSNKSDIVIFVVDESAHDQTLYLTSPDGTLRRVVQVKSGVGSEIRITDKERKAFQEEKQYWMDRLAPVSKTKQSVR
jgi:hypothetical protein